MKTVKEFREAALDLDVQRRRDAENELLFLTYAGEGPAWEPDFMKPPVYCIGFGGVPGDEGVLVCFIDRKEVDMAMECGYAVYRTR